MYKKKKVSILVQLMVDGNVAIDDGGPIGYVLEEMEPSQLRNWFDRMLRQGGCNAARKIMPVLDQAVWAKAREHGMDDALHLGESRVAPSAMPLWKSGYETGFAEGMSIRAGEL